MAAHIFSFSPMTVVASPRTRPWFSISHNTSTSLFKPFSILKPSSNFSRLEILLVTCVTVFHFHTSSAYRVYFPVWQRQGLAMKQFAQAVGSRTGSHACASDSRAWRSRRSCPGCTQSLLEGESLWPLFPCFLTNRTINEAPGASHFPVTNVS